MKTELFDYELPDELVARRPLPARDGARLLVLGRDGIEHREIVELPDLVPEGALLVVNDTRVIRARVIGKRRGSGGRAEILLLRRTEAGGGGEKWHALGRASKPLRDGSVIEAGALEIEILEQLADGTLSVRVSAAESVDAALERHGRVPIPPYLGRDDDVSDVERYQTVYARHAGSVAAPTAGLHFTPELLLRLEARGVEIGALTLHVGLATFRPVTAKSLDLHPMHSEAYEVSGELARRIALTRERGGKVVAIGTTVVRALESAADPERSGRVRQTRGETRLFIRPGHRFRVVDALLTNFHQPKSTLLALVSAFAGRERVLDAYRAAVAFGYRFLSYGDAMWIPERLEAR